MNCRWTAKEHSWLQTSRLRRNAEKTLLVILFWFVIQEECPSVFSVSGAGCHEGAALWQWPSIWTSMTALKRVSMVEISLINLFEWNSYERSYGSKKTRLTPQGLLAWHFIYLELNSVTPKNRAVASKFPPEEFLSGLRGRSKSRCFWEIVTRPWASPDSCCLPSTKEHKQPQTLATFVLLIEKFLVQPAQKECLYKEEV